MAPSSEYLQKLGTFVYAVADLEWDILGDIRVASSGEDVVRLLGLSTGQIGRALNDRARAVSSRTNVHHFVHTGAMALLDVADRRNAVLHARPGLTGDGEHQLLRLREGADGEPVRFWIDGGYLDTQISRVTYWSQRVNSARLLPLD